MSKKSTNVRIGLVKAALRGTGRALSAVSPALAARWAEGKFFAPQRVAVRSRQAQGFLETGRARALEVAGERVVLWSWGHGPRVLLVHGWSGNAGQMTAFVPSLVAAGFAPVAFDLPAHGLSPGRTLDLARASRVVRGVAEAMGGAHGVVAHSFGAGASAAALRDGLGARRAAFVAPAAAPRTFLEAFAGFTGLSDAAVRLLTERAERRVGLPLGRFAVPLYAPELETPLLVVHDAQDGEVPVADGRAIAAAWPGARYVETHGLGHNRPLYTPEVVRVVVDFVAGRDEPSAPPVRLHAAPEALRPVA